jgi:hypothetical protein
MFLLIFNEQRSQIYFRFSSYLLRKPHLFVILTAIGWFIVNIQWDLFWHRCLERQAFCTPRMYTLSPSKSIEGNNYGEFLKDENVLLCTRLYKYAPNLESLLTQQYVCVMCTLWSDNACVFTQIRSLSGALSYDNLSSVSQNVLKIYQQLTGEERRIPFIFDDFHFCHSRVIGLDTTDNRIFTLCRMITWVVFLRMFWNFISSLPVKRGGMVPFIFGWNNQ